MPLAFTLYTARRGGDKEKGEEATQLYLEVIETGHDKNGKPTVAMAESMVGLGNLYSYEGEYDEADQYFQKGLDLQKNLLGIRHTDTATTLYSWAYALNQRGDFQQALPLFREVLPLYAQIYTPSHWLVGYSHHQMGIALHRIGKSSEAIQNYKHAVEVFQSENSQVQAVIKALPFIDWGLLSIERGHYTEADSLLQNGLAFLQDLKENDFYSLVFYAKAHALKGLNDAHRNNNVLADLHIEESLDAINILIESEYESTPHRLCPLNRVFEGQNLTEGIQNFAEQLQTITASYSQPC